MFVGTLAFSLLFVVTGVTSCSENWKTLGQDVGLQKLIHRFRDCKNWWLEMLSFASAILSSHAFAILTISVDVPG